MSDNALYILTRDSSGESFLVLALFIRLEAALYKLKLYVNGIRGNNVPFVTVNRGLSVEAIEGTDKAIQRGGKLSSKAATVVKVSKPSQDNRFDIPTVGLRTLKTMKRYGANVLAIEAGATFIVEEEKMINFANKNKMVVVAI